MPNSQSPVIPGLEHRERIFGKDQPEYRPLPALVSPGVEREVMSRWELTPDERQAIAEGADIFLSIWTFGAPYPPTLIQIAHKDKDRARLASRLYMVPGEGPDSDREQ